MTVSLYFLIGCHHPISRDIDMSEKFRENPPVGDMLSLLLAVEINVII